MQPRLAHEATRNLDTSASIARLGGAFARYIHSFVGNSAHRPHHPAVRAGFTVLLRQDSSPNVDRITDA